MGTHPKNVLNVNMSFEGMAERSPDQIIEEDQEEEGVDVLGELEKQRKIFS